MADATIVVVRSRKSRRRQLRRAMETLTQLEIPLAGLVLNDETADEAHAFGYGYGYYYSVDGDRKKKNPDSVYSEPMTIEMMPQRRARPAVLATIEFSKSLNSYCP